MTKEELLKFLRDHEGATGDPEVTHIEADRALLAYINDDEITKAFEAITKWYA
jgi:hypothetical protein